MKKYLVVDGPAEVQISHGNNDVEILMSCDQTIQIEKMFGPTIFADLRIRADLERGEWVIERLGYDEWKEWATIPAQLDSDFPYETHA